MFIKVFDEAIVGEVNPNANVIPVANISFDKEDKNAKQNLINSVVYTMTQFTEINSVKFLVDCVENEELKIST